MDRYSRCLGQCTFSTFPLSVGSRFVRMRIEEGGSRSRGEMIEVGRGCTDWAELHERCTIPSETNY